jgi:hypothetical protein
MCVVVFCRSDSVLRQLGGGQSVSAWSRAWEVSSSRNLVYASSARPFQAQHGTASGFCKVFRSNYPRTSNSTYPLKKQHRALFLFTADGRNSRAVKEHFQPSRIRMPRSVDNRSLVVVAAMNSYRSRMFISVPVMHRKIHHRA